jgi:hypothetical protein
LFDISGADTDGWVEGRLSLKFPPTDRFKNAIVEVMRFPAKRDFPLNIDLDDHPTTQRALHLEQTERIVIPLSSLTATKVDLSASQAFQLGAPDTRQRSYRIVNIDFE